MPVSRRFKIPRERAELAPTVPVDEALVVFLRRSVVHQCVSGAVRDEELSATSLKHVQIGAIHVLDA